MADPSENWWQNHSMSDFSDDRSYSKEEPRITKKKG